jgi:hypothetical protein
VKATKGCLYVTRKRNGEKVACTHRSRLARLGMAVVSVCKCHLTRLRKQKRYRSRRWRRKELRLR